jgi:hypothetical protein
MNEQLIPIGDIQSMAAAVSKSGFFGLKTPEQAAALMLVAQADGLHPAKAATHYHIIQGRPSLSADAMLARFQSAGGRVNWDEYGDAAVIGTFTHPAGGSVTIRWDIARAKKAGVGNLEKYPAAMMRARCISEGVRTVYPGVIVGMYTPEETEQFTPVVNVVPEPLQLADSYNVEAAIYAMNQSATLDELKAAWAQVIMNAPKQHIPALTAAKDARKKELE